jgi:hypothetical protein
MKTKQEVYTNGFDHKECGPDCWFENGPKEGTFVIVECIDLFEEGDVVTLDDINRQRDIWAGGHMSAADKHRLCERYGIGQFSAAAAGVIL